MYAGKSARKIFEKIAPWSLSTKMKPSPATKPTFAPHSSRQSFAVA